MDLYDETDAIMFLAGLGKPWLRTGSREICVPAPLDTDADFVVLDLSNFYAFEANGYTMTTNQDDSYGATDFETYRQGEVNLIVVHSWDQFRAWRAATAAAKQMNIKDKQKRIALFQGVLYGNW